MNLPPADQAPQYKKPDLAEVIRRLQWQLMHGARPHQVFDVVLAELLQLAGSEHGFVGEVWRDRKGAPLLKIFTASGVAIDAVEDAQIEREMSPGIELRGPESPLIAAVVEGVPLIANEAGADPRLAEGLPWPRPLRNFLGVPLHHGGEVVAMVGLANRPGGYGPALVAELDSLFQSMAAVAAAVQFDRRRRSVEALPTRSDERWREQLELVGLGMAVVGLEGYFIDASPRMCELVGRTREELLRLKVADVTHPDDMPANRLLFKQLMSRTRNYHAMQKRYIRPDGSEVWALMSAAVVLDAEGNFQHSVAVALDIDQYKRTEAALRERELQFGKLATKVPGVLLQFRLDHDGRATVPYANGALRELFELDPEGPVREDARLMIERVVKGQRGRVWGSLEHSGRSLKPWQLEFEVDLPTRGRRWVEGRGSPERLADGSTLWHGYLDDITERKRYEEAVVAAEASARANAAKTEFLSRMSHELRTPLNAVLGFAQLLASDRRSPLDEGQRLRVAHIEHAGQHLLAMIGDVLDLSRIEGGSLPLALQPVAVQRLIDESLALVATTARAAGVRLAQSGAAPGEALHLRADPMRLRQVMVNLLSNAIKYNRVGGQVSVEVQVMPAPEAAGTPGRVRLAVTDTGKGLTPMQQTHLFEPFNRLGAERGEVEGTGLGLAITLRLVELMDGAIVVRSEAGQGSTFIVELPQDRPPQVAEPPLPAVEAALATPATSAELVVLYAEDNELNIELVRQLLTLRAGCELRIARSGREAIGMALTAPPDLLLIDMHLGDMGGVQVLEALRDDAALRGVPRIALSADALPQSIALAREAGFDEYLTKPVDIGALLNCLDRHRGRRASSG